MQIIEKKTEMPWICFYDFSFAEERERVRRADGTKATVKFPLPESAYLYGLTNTHINGHLRSVGAIRLNQSVWGLPEKSVCSTQAMFENMLNLLTRYIEIQLQKAQRRRRRKKVRHFSACLEFLNSEMVKLHFAILPLKIEEQTSLGDVKNEKPSNADVSN